MAETRNFQAEVSRLLDIVAHSIYSDRQVFLRELVSNASDACDRRRYLALTQPELGVAGGTYQVVLSADEAAGVLTIRDNGVGMSEEELVENLGTIARSGTSNFVKDLKENRQESDGDAKGDVSLIGQFGVGFYSSFMVADKVEVISRKAGEATAHCWESDGKGAFTVDTAERDEPGTTIRLHLREDARDFLQEARLRSIIRSYADHIALPILLDAGGKTETINSASALWTRSKSEITPEQLKEFYHAVGHAYDEPWATLHYKAEGKIEYTALLFVPSTKPYDLFEPTRAHSVRLYVRRVFVTDKCAELIPAYLRFVKGVVDSEDLPLNINRETLQANPMIAKIRAGVTKRVLSELAKKAKDASEDYAKFWENFGAVLKEGLYEDFEQREALLGLTRFRSTQGEGLVGLEDYVTRMKPGQKAIYTITADSVEAALRSPQLEGFRAKGVEVLLLTDPVDEFWLPMVARYKDFEFHSVTRGGAELKEIEGPEGEKDKAQPDVPANAADLVALLKLTLGEAVKDVRTTDRLTDSPVCLVADEGDMDMHLARLLKQHKQLDQVSARILEVNPHHPLIRRLADSTGSSGASAGLEDAAWLLLDQARIVEGEALPDPVAFARRLASCIERGLA